MLRVPFQKSQIPGAIFEVHVGLVRFGLVETAHYQYNCQQQVWTFSSESTPSQAETYGFSTKPAQRSASRLSCWEQLRNIVYFSLWVLKGITGNTASSFFSRKTSSPFPDDFTSSATILLRRHLASEALCQGTGPVRIFLGGDSAGGATALSGGPQLRAKCRGKMRRSKGGTTYPLFIPLGFPCFQPSL